MKTVIPVIRSPSISRTWTPSGVSGESAAAKPLGAIGHRIYANLQDPGDFLGIDRWDSLEGLQHLMGDVSVQADIGNMFNGPPDVTVCAEREGW